MRAMLLRFALVVGLGSVTTVSQAYTTCQNTPNGPLCTSQVSFSRFAQSAFQAQAQSQWCWAASISMLFAYHGYQVPQARIVSEAYGSVVNMPAVAGVVMAQALNRTWLDENNVAFVARLNGVYDAMAGVGTLDNGQLIRELDQDRPFVIGTAGHAVVVTAMQYYSTVYGPYVVGVGVFDPWPGRGARGLSVQEMTPVEYGGALSFVATVQTDKSTGSAAQNPYSTGAGSLDVFAILTLIVAAVAVALVQGKVRR